MKLFEEYQRLINNLPHPKGTFTLTQDNSRNFGDYIFNSTNIYFGFDVLQSNNCSHVFDCKECKECIDCTELYQCQKCYDSVQSYKSFGLYYCDYCAACIECYFCLRCKELQNCFGCVNLENKQYCIFNKQYSKEEYTRKIQELLRDPPSENIRKLYVHANNYPAPEKALPRRTPNINAPYGDYIYRAINCYYCFNGTTLTGCGYMFDSNFMGNSWDCSRSNKCIECYECLDTHESNNSIWLINCHKCTDSIHCYWCRNCQDCLGCVNLENKSYCILNRQLDKETLMEVKKVLKQNINTDLAQYLNNNID